ncbi:thioesterase [Streptomyces sp. SID7982]|nr:thioesterase [Streptomyces sp. SID7982]
MSVSARHLCDRTHEAPGAAVQSTGQPPRGPAGWPGSRAPAIRTGPILRKLLRERVPAPGEPGAARAGCGCASPFTGRRTIALIPPIDAPAPALWPRERLDHLTSRTCATSRVHRPEKEHGVTNARSRGVAARGGWIRQYHPPRGDAPTLVCFPHAGGAASAYFALSAALSEGAEVLVVQYPGRQDRLEESALEDLGEMADGVVAALKPWADRPLTLFGHSMGSVVAYEAARRLERGPGPGPAGLIVSGNMAPSVERDQGIHRKDDEELMAWMSDLAGTPPAVLADRELLATVIPALRGDFTALETYRHPEGGAVACPISGYVGKDDPYVPYDGFARWAEHTTAEFTAQIFEGGHFYIEDQVQDVTRSMLRDLSAFVSRRAVQHPLA